MAENEDLEVLGSVGSTRLSSADEETEEGAGDEVEKGEHRPIVPVVIRTRIGVSDPHGRREVLIGRFVGNSATRTRGHRRGEASIGWGASRKARRFPPGAVP